MTKDNLPIIDKPPQKLEKPPARRPNPLRDFFEEIEFYVSVKNIIYLALFLVAAGIIIGNLVYYFRSKR